MLKRLQNVLRGGKLEGLLDGFHHSLRINLSRTSVSLLETSGWNGADTTLLGNYPLAREAFANPAQLAEELRRILTEADCSNLPATVELADEWTRLFMVTPPVNAAWLQDCRAAAILRFQSLYDEPVTGWIMEADWDVEHPFLACAIPSALKNALCNVAAERHLTLTETAPQFVAALNRYRCDVKPGAWFGVVSANVLTLGAIYQKRLHEVRTAPVPVHALRDRQWLPEQLTREALRLNLPPPGEIQLCGEIPAEWLAGPLGTLVCTRLETDASVLNIVPPSLDPAQMAQMAQMSMGTRP